MEWMWKKKLNAHTCCNQSTWQLNSCDFISLQMFFWWFLFRIEIYLISYSTRWWSWWMDGWMKSSEFWLHWLLFIEGNLAWGLSWVLWWWFVCCLWEFYVWWLLSCFGLSIYFVAFLRKKRFLFRNSCYMEDN